MGKTVPIEYTLVPRYTPQQRWRSDDHSIYMM